MDCRKYILISCGGHANVLLDALLLSGLRISGVLDTSIQAGQRVFDIPVIGDNSWLENSNYAIDHFLINGLGSQPHSCKRQNIYEFAKHYGFTFINVVHPTAIIGSQVDIHEGAQIMAGAIIQARSTIGANVIVNTGAQVDHGCKISDHTFIGPGAVLCGDIKVGNSVYIGAGAVLLPGIVIGDGAIVAAGAVVKKNVNKGMLIAGNPRVI